MQGTAGNDVLVAPNLPRTTIITGGGNDVVTGGPGVDTVMLPATWNDVLSLGGVTLGAAGQLFIPTPLGTVTATGVERLQMSDGTLLATDLRLPVYTVTDGDPTGQVLALAYWGFGGLPGPDILGHWVGVADRLGDLGALAQAVLDAVAPGLPLQDLVAHLFQQVTGRPATTDEVQGFVSMVGPGLTFATHGDLYAAVAGLVPVPVELVGVVQLLEMGNSD